LAGWLKDPSRRHELRYRDDSGWTPHVADSGALGSDEAGAAIASETAPDGRTGVGPSSMNPPVLDARGAAAAIVEEQPTEVTVAASGTNQPPDSSTAVPPSAPNASAATDSPAEVELSREGTRRRPRWTFALAALMPVLAVGAFLALRAVSDRDEPYLDKLRAAGLAGRFNSDANAVAHAKNVCRQLESGSAQQGQPADKIAVDVYCPEFSKGFNTLETVTVKGTFVLSDYSFSRYSDPILTYGGSCFGNDGYDDVRSGTQVTVTDDSGRVVARSELGSGSGTTTRCEFPFSFELTEGSESYTVAVGRRGQLSYSFTELKLNGVSLSLGN